MRKFSLTRRQMLVVAHDLLATAAAVIVSFYVRFEAAGLESRLDGLIADPARLRALCRLRLLPVRPARGEVAVHLAARFRQHRARRDGAGGLAARARLRAGLARVLRRVLLRQDHDPALLVPADRIPGRNAHRLPAFPLCAHAPSCARRAGGSDPGARARGRCRGAAARDRERRREPGAPDRHPVAVGGGSRPVDPRHSGGRRPR